MDRRAFVTGLGAVLAVPLCAEAQPARIIPRVGVVPLISEPQSIVIEWRWRDEQKLPEQMAELVRLKVDVIVPSSSAAVLAASKATGTIAIVANDLESDPTRRPNVITDIASYLRLFDSIHRRTARDVAALPPNAAAWRPPAVEGETGWSIGDIVGHIGGARLYFASAYRGAGWIEVSPEVDRDDARTWVPWLQSSADRFSNLLRDTPTEWLTRKIEMIDTPGSLSGWRILMMMIEHEVHHRSQIDTYAGLEGWPVPDIFGRSAETIRALQPAQKQKATERAATKSHIE